MVGIQFGSVAENLVREAVEIRDLPGEPRHCGQTHESVRRKRQASAKTNSLFEDKVALIVLACVTRNALRRSKRTLFHTTCARHVRRFIPTFAVLFLVATLWFDLLFLS